MNKQSEPSGSAEEGEEKPEEGHVTTSERSIGSRSPSDTGSTDRDMICTTDMSLKRTVDVSARPPRPGAESCRREASSPIASDGYRSPVDRKEQYSGETASSTGEYNTLAKPRPDDEMSDLEPDARSRPRTESREVDRREPKGRAYAPPTADGDDLAERKPRADSMDGTTSVVVDTEGQQTCFGDTVSMDAWEDENLTKQTTEGMRTDGPVGNTMSTAKESFSITKDESGCSATAESLVDASLDAAEMSSPAPVQGEAEKKRVPVMENKGQSTKTSGLSVNQELLKTSIERKIAVSAAPECTVPDFEESKVADPEKVDEQNLMDATEADKRPTQNDDVDMAEAAFSDQLCSSSREVPVSDVEMKSTGNEAEQRSVQELSSDDAPSSSLSYTTRHESMHVDESAIVTLAVQPKDAISEVKEIEEGEMVMSPSEKDSLKSHIKAPSNDYLKSGENKNDGSSSKFPEQTQEGKRAEAAARTPSTLHGLGTGRHKRKLERSRTDPTDSNKPRSTSFSSFVLPDSSRHEEGAREENKLSSRAETEILLTSAQSKKQDMGFNQREEASTSTQRYSLSRSGRPALDRRASFSALPERSHYSLDSRLSPSSMGYADGSKTSRANVSLSNKSSPPKPSFATSDSNVEGRRRGLHDDLKKEEAVRRELLRAGSVDTMMDRSIQRAFPGTERVQALKESSTSATNSPSRRSVSNLRDSLMAEEPALPDIPLPSGAIRGSSSPTLLGEGTPTKRHRPRLGWGQGLVAPSPPQPTKRPRIGWGQGLMQQNDDSSREKEDAVVASEEGDAFIDVTHPSPAKTEETNVTAQLSEVHMEVPITNPTVADKSNATNILVVEEKTRVIPTPEKEKSPLAASVKGASTPVKNETEANNDPPSIEGDCVDVQDTAPAKPSKEEILSTIDVLDADIAGVKKQIKALTRTIASAEIQQEPVSKSVDKMIMSGDGPSSAIATTKPSSSGIEDSPNYPTNTSSVSPRQELLSSPVKVAVDSRFVELLAGVFSDNLRKTNAANEQLPKRIEHGQLATKIYHQPSDYSFYQENIDRGLAMSEQVRLKVRKRNRARHDYMKKLARDYVDLKKSWKLGVKKMEKDRKRQDKLRLKQLQKQKLKSMGESGPIRTTNTNHQSPHVQQLVAAEKAAEAAGSEGAVRTSSRLTNNSSGDLDNNDLEKIEQAKAQALIDQEVRKKRLKNALSTIIPDMLITPAERQQRYFTRFVNGQSCMADGLVTDWKLKEKAEMKVNPWNDLEKCIYMDKFLQFPKNFPRISAFLKNKTTGDVIAFYYRTKKVADYKALLREQQLRRRGAGSKNTWSCWNLSACAAICLGVQFPEHVAKLLLHPSNFRSHQASDNVLNSAGAQRLLRGSASKVDGNADTPQSIEETGSGTTGVLSALELVSGSDHTPCVRSSMPEVGVHLDDIVSSGDSDTSDEEKFNLYTQQLEQFIAGQQRPFLVDYTSLLSDNSYSTGYEVSTLSIEERLKKYPTPSKELESATNGAATGNSASAAPQNPTFAKVKQQSHVAGPSGTSKNGGPHLTKKELKQQRKMKKMHDGTGAAVTTPTAALSSSQSVGNTGGEKNGNHSRKKGSSSSSVPPSASSSSRTTPRISIPGDDKPPQGGKKTSRSGGGTPASRRSSQQPNATNVSPKTTLVTSSSTITGFVSVSAPTLGSVRKGAGGSTTPHANAKSSPSANAIGSSNGNPAVPAKRVQYGKDWATLTENIPTKTAAQIKNYYQNYKNRLNLQDILKRRIENAATSGTAKGASHPVAVTANASSNMAASPRSAAAGLMSGTLRQMGRPVDLAGGISMGMTSGSMSMSVGDGNMSFQAALSAAQPGMHNVGVLSELSATQFGMQAHQDPQQQQQQSREMMNSNPERYLKLLNMQHQLQFMQLQQQHKSQGMASESTGGGNNNTPYHDEQMNAANAQRLYQFSRQQQQQVQHQVPPQHLSLQALQQLGISTHAQTSSHSQMMQLPIQQQQQARGSYTEMGHAGTMYQSMAQMQTQQHSQAMATATQIGLSSTSAQQYNRSVENSASAADGRGNLGGAPNQIGQHDGSQRSMVAMTMMNNAATANANAIPPTASSCSPHPAPSCSMPMETSRPEDVKSGKTTWQPSPPAAEGAKMQKAGKTTSKASQQDTAPKGREAVAPPAPPPVQPVRSRMSFSSILNESESPREDTPRGNGSMVIRQQESPRITEQQRQEQEQQQREQQQREHQRRGQQQREQQQREQQQREQQQLRLEHARAMPPSSADVALSPVSAPSPTAHLLPRRSSAPAPHNRMGLMSSLLNVPSPERRTSNPGHQSPLMHQQQQMQRQIQTAQYYDPSASNTDSTGSSSRGSMATMVSSIPVSSTVSSAMVRSSPNEKMSTAASMANYTNTSAQMAVALSRSGSGSSTSSAVSANTVKVDPHAQQLQQHHHHQQQQQQQMWNYAPPMRYEEAELLLRAQRAEEEAARAAAAAAAAARALQEAQKARQQALDMAANMARYNSAMQQQQVQQHQQTQHQAQHQAQQQQQVQQYQQLQYQQLQAHQQQMQQQQQQQQHEYHHQHQAQQLHQQQMQHQALHHHLQLMQQQQQRSAVSPSDHLLQQQLHQQQQQQQQPPRGPQPER
ncbi:unnamed protein product [Phytophthora fragariaefolia]|uniref:Unnamed protein product n=1 Tax=Phytophthora fragariaefolia TaxID=1490495 RepID=A0A9W7CM92_9STRA|nr:unnamed protein product [Phytophthora fragariaefolia]